MTKLHDAKPFVIAEVGSNFYSLGDAISSIKAAKQCGADAVKFQLFDGKALYGFDREVKGSVFRSWLPELKEAADDCNIELMCTAFSEELFDVVDPFVEVHKVASSDATHRRLLKHVAAKGKPMLVSTGACDRRDVALICAELVAAFGPSVDPAKRLTLLYCNASYPSYEHNLFVMDELKEQWPSVGFSDHSLDVVYAPLSAVRHFGATVIEKHFRLDRIKDTPDAPHSLNEGQFKLMVDYLKGHRDHRTRTDEERRFHVEHKRRPVALAPIEPGEELNYGVNYGLYRRMPKD